MSVKCALCLLPVVFLCTTHSFALPAVIPGTDGESPPQSFPLDQPGEHVFHFRQARTGEMTLMLKVEGKSGEPDRVRLTHSRSVIEATLLNHAGRTVCYALGSPKDGVGADGWVLTTSGAQAAFWHRNCAEIKLKRSEPYTLEVRIRDVDPKAPNIKVTPVFERSDTFGP